MGLPSPCNSSGAWSARPLSRRLQSGRQLHGDRHAVPLQLFLGAVSVATLGGLRHHQLRPHRMIMQILDAQAHGLAWTCASNRQRVGQQPELVIDAVGGGDEFAHRVVGQDDVAGGLRVRQIGQPDFPSVPVLNPLVVLCGLLQRGTHASDKPVDRRRCHRAQQTVAPVLQFGGRQQCHRLRQQRAGEMQARPVGIVGIGVARRSDRSCRRSARRPP